MTSGFFIKENISPSTLNTAKEIIHDRKTMTTTVPENRIDLIIDKLDQVKLELMRLRATLIPEEESTP